MAHLKVTCNLLILITLKIASAEQLSSILIHHCALELTLTCAKTDFHVCVISLIVIFFTHC